MEEKEKRFGSSNKYSVTKTSARQTQEGKSDKMTPGESTAEDRNEQEEATRRMGIVYRYFYVVILLVDTMITGIIFPVMAQFRYRFFQSQHQHELDRFNFTHGKSCGIKLDPQVQAIENQISHDSSEWNQYDNYVAMTPLIVSSVIIGMKSDQIGRRFIFIFSTLSGLAYISIYPIVVRCQLHYGWTLIGSFLSGCTGGSMVMFSAGYAIISDTHGNTKPSVQGAETEDDATGALGSPENIQDKEAGNSNIDGKNEHKHGDAERTATDALSKGRGRDNETFNGEAEQENIPTEAKVKTFENKTFNTHADFGKNPSEADTLTNSRPTVRPEASREKGAASSGTEHVEDELDMSREKSRILKIVGLQVSQRLASSIMSFATGYIIRYAGFFYTLVMVLCVKVIILGLILVFVQETGQQRKSTAFLEPMRIFGRALKDPTRRVTLTLVLLGIVFTMVGSCEELDVMRTYQMSPPFCLDAVQMGWIDSEARLMGIFSLPLMLLWRRLGLTEPIIAAIGLFCSMLSFLLVAIVRSVWVFYVRPLSAIPTMLSLAMTKTIISRLIGHSALASTFSLMGACEEFFLIVGSIASNYIYQRFLATLPTAPFYMAVGCFFVATLLFLGTSWSQRHQNQLKAMDAEDLDL